MTAKNYEFFNSLLRKRLRKPSENPLRKSKIRVAR